MRHNIYRKNRIPFLISIITLLSLISLLNAATPSFSAQNITINIPPTVLNVNVTVPATNPVNGTLTKYSTNMEIPINAISFNVTLPASVSYAVYNALNQSLNQTVLYNVFSNSLNSALPAAVNQSTNQTAINIAKSYVNPLSSTLSQSLSYTLPASMATVLPKAIAVSLGASLSSSLYNNLPPALSQSLSQSLSEVIPIVASGAINYTRDNTPSGTSGPTPSQISSYIASSLNSNLTKTMQPMLSKTLSTAVDADLATSLKNSIPTALATAGLQNNISVLINQSLKNQLNQSIYLASASAISSNTTTKLSKNLIQNISYSLSTQLASDLSSQLSAQLSSSLSSQVSQNLGSGIAAYASEDFASNMGSSLETSIPSYLGGSYPGGYAVNPYQFGSVLGAPPTGVPYTQISNGSYMVTATNPEYMNAGQLSYILLDQMPSIAGRSSAGLGLAIGAATQGLTPYSAMTALQMALPVAVPGAISSSVSYVVGSELGAGLNSGQLLGIGTALSAYSGSPTAAALGTGALYQVQAGLPGTNYGYLLESAGAATGNMGLIAAGSLMGGYSMGGVPGLVAGVGASTGSAALMDAAMLGGEYYQNVNAGYFALSAASMLGYSNYALPASYALAAMQGGGNIGSLTMAMAMLSGSSHLMQAGYALSLLQSGSNPLFAVGALTGSTSLEAAGGALALLQGGTTLGNGLTYAGAYSGSTGLMGSGELMNMYGSGGTVGTSLGALGGYYGGPMAYGAMGLMSGDPYAAGLMANGGYGTALEALSAMQSGVLNQPTTAAFALNLGNLPVGITAVSGLNGGTSAAVGLTTGYGTLLGGILPVSALSSVNFILPQSTVGGLGGLSGLLPGIPGLSGLLNEPLPDINQYISGLGFGNGFGIPGIGSLGGGGCLVAVACEGIQNLFGPLPNLQGILPGLPNGILPGIPGLDLSNFNIPGLNLGSIPGLGLGNILSGFGTSTTYGAGGIVSGTLGANVGIGGATLTSGLNIDLGKAMAASGVPSGMIGAIGSTVGYASAALNAYFVLSNFGSSVVTVTGIGSVSTPFNTNQSIGSSIVINPGTSGSSQSSSPSSSSSSSTIGDQALGIHAITITSNATLNNQVYQQSGTASSSQSGSQPAQPAAQGISPGQSISTNINLIPQKQTISVSAPYQFSPATQVAVYNQQNAPWFLTCPTAPSPDPTNDMYFEANQGMNVAGDACIAVGSTLDTIISISTTVHTNSPCIPLPSPSAISNPLQAEAVLLSTCAYSIVQPLSVENPGILSLNVLTYSPEVDGMLSNGYSTDSYIFQQVPSMAQNAIWTWNVEYANFNNPSAQNSDAARGLLLTTGFCTWSYNYRESTSLTSMSNNYIPFNELISLNGQPAASMLNTQVPGAIQPSISGAIGSQIAGSATSPTSAVIGTIKCIGGAVINGQCVPTGAGSASDLPYTGKDTLPNNTNQKRTLYQPISGAPSPSSVPGSPSSTGLYYLAPTLGTFGEATIDTNVLPLLYFNYSIALTPGVPGQIQGLTRESESIFNPWTYYTPNYSIDQFPINLPGIFIFQNQNNVLSYLPQSGSGINLTANPNPVMYYMFTSSGGVSTPSLSGTISPTTGTPTNLPSQTLTPSATNPSSTGTTPVTPTSLLSNPNPGILGSCPTSSIVLSRQQADACAQQAGFENTGDTVTTLGLDTVVAISEAESSLNSQNMHNNGKVCTKGANAGQESLDVVIMQINNCAHPNMVSCTGTTFSSCTGSATTVVGSFQDAYVLSDGGTNFNPWCTYGPSACGGYGNSAYCQYMPAGDPCENGGTGAGLIATTGIISTPPYLSQMSAYGITSPISMTSPGNGYVYVLFQNPNQNSAYEIAIIKNFPRGYYNATNVPLPPLGTSDAICSSESTCQSTWSQTWSNYWYNVMNVQAYQSYIVDIIPITSLFGAATSGTTLTTPGTTTTGPGTTTTLPTNPQQTSSGLISGAPFNGRNESYNLTFQAAQSSASTGQVLITAQTSTVNYPQGTTINAYCTPSTDPCFIQSPLGTTIASGTGEATYSTPSGLPVGSYVYYVKDAATGQTSTTSLTVEPQVYGLCSPSGLEPSLTQPTDPYAIPLGSTQNYLNPSCNFVPYNISTDANGDIFLTGITTTNGNNPLVVKVANVLINGKICPPTASAICDQFSVGHVPTTTSGISLPTFTEIASSPSGENVYLASPNYGGILVFSGTNLGYLYTIPLTFGQVYPGANPGVSGSASQQQASTSSQLSSLTTTPGYTAVLDIAYWLNNGGLFNYPIPISNVQSGSTIQSADLDQPGNHHPLAIANINGYLYVLDNWKGQLASGTNFNILMLRAINSTGASVPIDPSKFNDIFAQNTCSNANLDTNACYTGGTNAPPPSSCSAGCVPEPDINSPCGSASSVSVGEGYVTPIPSGYNYKCVSDAYSLSTNYYSLATTLSPKETYPPYGWIISATVGSLNFCGAPTCVQTESTILPSSTYAVGPELSSTGCTPVSAAQSTLGSVISWISQFFTGCGTSVSMSVDANGTVSILMPQNTGNNVNQNEPSEFQYPELLISKFNLENYTKVREGTPPFICYTTIGGGTCNAYPNMANIQPPIYTTGDPFFYEENQGSQQILAYANQYYSQFTGGGGTPQNLFLTNGGTTAAGAATSATTTTQEQCSGQLQQFQSPTLCATSQSGILGGSALTAGTQAQNLGQPYQTSVPSFTQLPGNNIPSSVALSSRVSGEALIGYKYTYELTQTFYNFVLSPASGCYATLLGCSSCFAAGSILSHMPPSIQSQTVYSYAPTPEVSSAYLTANVEGGDTYLQYGNGGPYYIQNLSDYGLFLSHHILLNTTGDRLFSSSYVATESPGGVIYLLNAMQQLQFLVQTFTRASQSYQTITSAPVNSGTFPNSGPAYAPITISVSPYTSNYIFIPEYSQPPYSGTVNLFDWYKEEIFSDPTMLYAPQLSGYQRIILAFLDRFNNTIFAPIDADVANITTINLNVSASVDFQNSNQTTLTISGIAGENSYNGFGNINQSFNPLSGGSIYIYMGQDMNYVTANGNIMNPQQAQLCAFGSPTSPYMPVGTPYPSSCNLANPMWRGLQAGASTVTYSAPSSCGPPPQSLLYTTQDTCNIYGAFGLPATCPSQSSGQAFCIPNAVTGNGICNSEYGLVGVTSTASNGFFTYSTNACGIGQVNIQAVYYGDSVQPLTAIQEPLVGSVNSIIGALPAVPVAFNAISYNWAPNESATIASIGLFELGVGDVSAIGIVVTVFVVLAIILYRKEHHKKNQRRHSHSKKPSSHRRNR